MLDAFLYLLCSQLCCIITARPTVMAIITVVDIVGCLKVPLFPADTLDETCVSIIRITTISVWASVRLIYVYN